MEEDHSENEESYEIADEEGGEVKKVLLTNPENISKYFKDQSKVRKDLLISSYAEEVNIKKDHVYLYGPVYKYLSKCITPCFLKAKQSGLYYYKDEYTYCKDLPSHHIPYENIEKVDYLSIQVDTKVIEGFRLVMKEGCNLKYIEESSPIQQSKAPLNVNPKIGVVVEGHLMLRPILLDRYLESSSNSEQSKAISCKEFLAEGDVDASNHYIFFTEMKDDCNKWGSFLSWACKHIS